ncbi:hypothetical protein [Methanobacterium petrolearium]|uniref:hypothetical protein n=1 Tax=Methanobacterium petrolearium TaxID=710190 RepID=UPI001AE8060C|nr:hypothetical protein [Methanobacterium petrolearium]MBP1945889.1 hypothetical protein [Methanobacterium petrolearium]BDZ69557.1 hypothetical protein GCM10025861_00740 [Methanobacterium petrolearium]
MKKIMGIIPVVLVLVVLASGCTSSSNNTSNQSSSNVTLQIYSNSTWIGDYGYKNGDMQINGTGNAKYNLGPNPGTVTVSLENNGTGTLTVQLLQGGNVIQTQSTSDNQGVVNINKEF